MSQFISYSSVFLDNSFDSLNLFSFKCNNEILASEGEVVESILKRATDEMLNNKCNYYTNLVMNDYCGNHALNEELIKFAVGNMQKKNDSRLAVPLLWNSTVSHLLDSNYNLSRKFFFKFKKVDKK